MSFSDILFMRHEVVLTILALLILIIDLNLSNKNKHLIIPVSLGLCVIHTIIGFFPTEEVSLFGGMYQSNALRGLMKNVLNVGVLIVLFQSVTLLKKPEHEEKNREYFILLFAT